VYGKQRFQAAALPALFVLAAAAIVSCWQRNKSPIAPEA
jgi:hypothetical protein